MRLPRINVMRAVAHRGFAALLAALLCASMAAPAFSCIGAASSNAPSGGPYTAFAEGDEGGGEDEGGGGSGGGGGSEEPHLADIPYVVGDSVPSAVSKLEAAGFQVNVQGSGTATSLVTSQNPTGQAEPGSTVTITGEEQLVSVPNVIGASVPAAVSKLEAAGFQVNVQGSDTSTSLVIAQDPTGQAEPGSTVTITGEEYGTGEATLAQIDLLAYSTDSYGQWIGQLGTEGLGGSAYRLSDAIKEKGGKIRLMLQASWSDGSMFKQSDAGWKDLGGEVRYSTSDASVAMVDSTGVVTAVSDGEAVITASAPGGLTSTMSVSVIGQNGAYVASARVTDETGEPYGTSYIEINDIAKGTRTFYVRVTYSDGTTACNAPEASDYSAEGAEAIASALTWTVSSSDVGSVNAASGTFVPSADGRTLVIASITGGDPNVGNGIVQASVSINVNTGKYEGGNAPSSQLKVEVEYETMPGVVGKEKTFSIAELQAIENASCTYTLTRSNGRYVTDTAQGIYLSTLLSSMGIAPSDVSHFRFAANDGANPGAIPAGFLFGYTRYYFPFANLGVTTGQVPVAPMLAYADSWKEGGSCEPSTELNSGTCLRLVFGSTGLADNSTSLSLKYINTMKVVMSGAPPVDWGKDPGGSGGGGEGNENKPSGTPDGKPDGSGGGANDGTADGTGDGDGSGDGGLAAGAADDDGDGGSKGVGASKPAGGEDGAADARDASDAGGDKAAGAQDSSDAAWGSSDAGGARWQVFEMMAKSDSDMPPLTMENPLEPFVPPLAAGALAAGAVSSGLRFRRWSAMAWGSGGPPAAAPA